MILVDLFKNHLIELGKKFLKTTTQKNVNMNIYAWNNPRWVDMPQKSDHYMNINL